MSAPPGWPPRRRRSPLAFVIALCGVLGALVLAVGGTALVAGRILDVVADSAPATPSAEPAAGARPSSPGELAAGLAGRHEGVTVDWTAPAHAGSELDPGLPVTDAPGILLVETVLGPRMGTGTGMVLTPEGLAVTNYHVVEDSSEVFVVEADTGRRHTATVLGRDAEHDIAVLDVQGVSDLPVVSISLDPVSRGETVAAVGNGRGQGHLSAVRGRVLGTGRSIMAASEGSDDYERLTGLIQIDADVVPGYSGGPVVDETGQVVGVTVAASDGTTASEVDGFAIPLKVAFEVVDQVLSGEESDTVSIGADGALGIMVGADPDVGVVVMQVDAGSAAEAIGLAEGDVILAIDGQAVGSNASRMSRLVNDHNVGDRITVTWRTAAGQEREAEAVLQAAVVN